MDYRAAIVVSCWLAVAVIASVCMWIFGSKLGDVFFGVFLPVRLLIVVALVVTLKAMTSVEAEKKREG